MDPIGKFIDLFFLTHRSLHNHLQEAKIVTTFSLAQRMSMRYSREEGHVGMKEIARSLSVSSSSATSLVKGLVHRGALECETHRRDRRITHLRATNSGARRLGRTESRVRRETGVSSCTWVRRTASMSECR
jgi:DNA-binding MarR family transcriptional regulator